MQYWRSLKYVEVDWTFPVLQVLVFAFIGHPESWLNPYRTQLIRESPIDAQLSTQTGCAPRKATHLANWLWFTRAHCAVYRGTRGLIGENLIGIHMLLLTTTGRKSGKTRTLPLAYVENKDEFIIVASNGGGAQSPAWWLNLSAAETAEIQIRGERIPVSWSVAPADERMAYWRLLQSAVPAYRRYRDVTEREIPIVRLRRLAAEWQTRPVVQSDSGIPHGAESTVSK
jgi:deazaflavin-dependent oxidoreductase (nitroreductase family)